VPEKHELSIVAEPSIPEIEVAKERKYTTHFDTPNLEYFSTIKFEEMPLSEQTQKAVAELGYKNCTEI
jgi:superfamily II DNA/RNA helicase